MEVVGGSTSSPGGSDATAVLVHDHATKGFYAVGNPEVKVDTNPQTAGLDQRRVVHLVDRASGRRALAR